MSSQQRRGVFAACLLVASAVACGQRQPAPETAPAPPAVEPAPTPPAVEPSSTPPPEQGAEPASTEPIVASEAPPKPQPPSGEGVRAACHAWCDRLSKQCSERWGRSCGANCGKYEEVIPECYGVAREALECAAQAADLICVALPPDSCIPRFRAIRACEKDPSAVRSEDSSSMPAGWQRFSDGEGGFSVPMPPGVQRADRGAYRAFHVTTADSATYHVVVEPGPGAKPSDKWLLRTAIDLVTPACQKELRLTGKFEKTGATVVRLDTACPDGKEWHGMLWAKPEMLHVVVVEVPPGAKPVMEPFIYGFEYSK